MSNYDPEDLVSIYEAKSLAEASIISGLLRSHGIEAVIDGEMRSTLSGYLPTADAHPHVLVLESDMTEALELLEKEGRPHFRRRGISAPARNASLKPIVAVLLAVAFGLVWYNVHLYKELERLRGNDITPDQWSEALSTSSCDVYIYNKTLHKSAEYCDPGNDGFTTVTKKYSLNGELQHTSYDTDGDGHSETIDGYNRKGERTRRYEDHDGDHWYETMTEFRNGRQVRYVDRNLDGFYDESEIVP